MGFINFLTDSGSTIILIIVLGFSFAFILRKEVMHKMEREAWGRLLDVRQSQLLDVIADNNVAIKELTVAVMRLEEQVKRAA